MDCHAAQDTALSTLPRIDAYGLVNDRGAQVGGILLVDRVPWPHTFESIEAAAHFGHWCSARGRNPAAVDRVVWLDWLAEWRAWRLDGMCRGHAAATSFSF